MPNFQSLAFEDLNQPSICKLLFSSLGKFLNLWNRKKMEGGVRGERAEEDGQEEDGEED